MFGSTDGSPTEGMLTWAYPELNDRSMSTTWARSRRTDWRAVGSHDNEQSELSVLSESSSDGQDQSSFEMTSDEPASSDFESTTLSSDTE